MPRTLAFAPALLLLPALAFAHDLPVEPYLQLATPTSVRILWETPGPADSQVEYGSTEALGLLASGDSFPGHEGSVHHDVLLDGLTPGERVWYRPVGAGDLPIRDFIAPLPHTAEAPLRLVAMSDMQGDSAHPDVFRQVIEEGVIPTIAAEHGPDLPAELDFALIPGDLVGDGRDYAQWADQFFTPGRLLFSRVPVYPTIGNHEADSDFYFDYFHLPDNGSPGFEEHWWFHDVGNVRILGLDSNFPYVAEGQTEWLEGVLDATCDLPEIDFVFAQLHHPFHSELWVPGENPWTGVVIDRLEQFSTACGKPSIHFFGHTHGYSRGESRDHQHLMVNVATAGGRIDRWGEYEQRDYPEYGVSQDEYGFVLVDVEAGEAPSFRLRRYSRGTPEAPRDNELTDEVAVRLDNLPPAQPEALSPPAGTTVDPFRVHFVASAFADPDGDAHASTQVQVAAGCDGFEAPAWEDWKQARNEYFGEDRQSEDDLTDALAAELPPASELCWRVRYRDAGLRWSDWSEPVPFTTDRASRTDNLLRNPGAEEDLEAWTADAGTLAIVGPGTCAGVVPPEGLQALALGGTCEPLDAGRASQQPSVLLWAGDIDRENRDAELRARVRTPEDGLATLTLVALDAGDAELLRGDPVAASGFRWAEVDATLPLPAGTRRVRLELASSEGEGAGVAWFDDLDLRLRTRPPAPAADDDDDDVEGCSGCSAAAAPSASLGLLLLPALLRRRRRP